MTLFPQEKDVQSTGHDVHLCVQISGDGSCPAIIFLSDLLSLQTKECWDNQFLGVMGHPYYLVRYDLRGSGCSSKPEDVLAYTGQHFAEDLEAVMAALDLHRVVAVAVGLGGYSLLAYVRRYREGRLAGIVFVDAMTERSHRFGKLMYQAPMTTWLQELSQPESAERREAVRQFLRMLSWHALDEASFDQVVGHALHPTIAAYARICAVPWRSAHEAGVAPALKGGAKPRC